MYATKTKTYHASAADVRACYQGSQVRTTEGGVRCGNSHTTPAPPSQAGPRNADQARDAAMQRLASQTSPWFPRGEAPRVFPASEGRVRLITALVEEHMTGTHHKLGQAILAELPTMSDDTAKATIAALLKHKETRKAEAAATPADPASNRSNRRGWDGLVKPLMGGRDENNFCIIDEQGKARFYRISKRGKQSRRPGTWKIQERVTDMLLPRADAMLTTVCQAIEAQGGPQAAGLRFAKLMHKCYKCGASLTDTTGNPYYAMGLGPECGAK